MSAHPVIAATDGEDLEILSARFQDAVVRAEDMTFRKGEGVFAMLANRFMGERPPKGFFKKHYFRVRAGLHFSHVLGVQALGPLAEAAKPGNDTVFSLLAIRMERVEPGNDDNPERYVTLHFAGGGAVRLHVECLEAEARDIAQPWATHNRPDHEGIF